MTALQTHNLQEIPLIAQIYANEWHLMQEAFKDLNPQDPDVKAALSDRVSDIITTGNEGARMASVVD